MILGMPPLRLALLGLLVFFAGIVDALAGGGGLITLPAYLAAGVDPALVLGTNKLASSIGTVASTARYGRALDVPWRPFAPVVAAAFLGSLIGARFTLLLDPSWLRWGLLVAVPVVGSLVWRGGWGESDTSHRYSAAQRARRGAAAALPIGAYDGFFGPGAGTFYVVALTRACGWDLLHSTGRAKLLNLASNVSALAAFLWAGRLSPGLGLLMGAVSVGGNIVGSHLAIRGGARVIRPAVVLVCALLFLKLLRDVVM